MLYASPLVRYVDVDSRTILLDIRDGQYLVMNKTASAMWRALVSLSTEVERLDCLSSDLMVSRECLEADTRAFMSVCLARGFLLATPPSRLLPMFARNRFDAPSLTNAWVSLVSTGLRVAGGNFRRGYDYALRLRKPAAPNRRMIEDLGRLQRTFVAAENLIPLLKAPIDCLPRSLALYGFLTRCGIEAHHLIGVQRFPFRAHAWVESDDQILLNDVDEVRRYTVIANV